MRLEFDGVLFREVVHDIRMFLREIVAALEADADNLPAIARMAPGVMPEPGMKPEMKIFRIERAIDDVVEFLPDEEPRNLLRIIGIDRARHERTRTVGADHLPRAVLDRLAV